MGLAERMGRLLPLRCRRGVTAMEYGLITSLVALALVSGAGMVGSHLNKGFSDLGLLLGYLVP